MVERVASDYVRLPFLQKRELRAAGAGGAGHVDRRGGGCGLRRSTAAEQRRQRPHLVEHAQDERDTDAGEDVPLCSFVSGFGGVGYEGL